MKKYKKYIIKYKDEVIDNILEINEVLRKTRKENNFMGWEVGSLRIEYINSNGKLVSKEFDINDLTFIKK